MGEAFEAYESAMESRNLCDFDDLVIRAADALESDPAIRAQYRQRHRWVSIDEYQDVDEQQVRLVKQLVGPDGNICAIGDPDQAIYGFRGADVRFFSEFRRDFPGAGVVRLTRNYRSDRNIVALSSQVIARSGSASSSVPVAEDPPELVTIHEAPTEKAEAEFVVQTLERILGGHSFFSIDSGRSEDAEGHDFSFSDFAVLYRTDAQVPALVEALRRSGMPFQHRSHHRLLDHPGVAAAVDVLRESPRRARFGSSSKRSVSAMAGATRRCSRHASCCDPPPSRAERIWSGSCPAWRWAPRPTPGTLARSHLAADPPCVEGARVPRGVHRRLRERAPPPHLGKASREVLDEERRLFYVG